MNRRLVLLAAVVGVAGCATEPPSALMPEQAAGMNNWDLCYVMASNRWGPISKGSAGAELQRRGRDCQAEMAVVQARLQQDGQRDAAAAYFLNQHRQQAPLPFYPMPVNKTQPPVTQTCFTKWVGGQWQTICQ